MKPRRPLPKEKAKARNERKRIAKTKLEGVPSLSLKTLRKERSRKAKKVSK